MLAALMKEYYNVFDSGFEVLGFTASGIIMVAIGIIIIILMKRNDANYAKIIFMYFWTGLGILWTTVAFIATGSEYLSCIRAMRNGTYQEVEGIVENFDPMPYSGHKNESFTVKGVMFEYSDYRVSAGFNNSKSHGGPINEGKYVRIKYYDGKILQLWVNE